MNVQPAVFGLCLAALITIDPSPIAGQVQQPGPSTEKEVLIRRILDVTKTAELMLVAIEAGLPAQRASNPGIPPVFWDRFAARTREQRHTLVDSLVPIYDKAFSAAELRELLQFYQTPLGKRLITASPEIARESMAAGQRWGMLIGQEIGEQLQREGRVPRP